MGQARLVRREGWRRHPGKSDLFVSRVLWAAAFGNCVKGRRKGGKKGPSSHLFRTVNVSCGIAPADADPFLRQAFACRETPRHSCDSRTTSTGITKGEAPQKGKLLLLFRGSGVPKNGASLPMRMCLRRPSRIRLRKRDVSRRLVGNRFSLFCLGPLI